MESVELKEGLNHVTEDAYKFAETEFFLNYSRKLKLVYLLKDTKLVDFFHNYYRDGYQPNIKGS